MSYKWPKLVSKPAGKQVVVLAPHMDDEIIGCAGSILKHIADGDEITVVYITDSSKGLPGRFPEREMADRRRQESESVGEFIGVKNRIYLNIEDNTEEPWDAYTDLLADVLIDKEPELLYLPWYEDLHSDHQKTNKLFAKAIGGRVDFKVCAYEVWSPLKPSIIVNITKQFKCKLKAMEMYRSQMALFPYGNLIKALNSYRACFIPLPGIRYAEAFFETGCQEYIKIIKNRLGV